MTKWMIPSAIAVAVVACSSDDPNPNPGRRDAGGSGLSVAFSENCSRCHGDAGLGNQFYPRIPGSRDEAGFIAIVRSGSGEMPKFAPTDISDADLKADYLWLTTKR
jgi:mono/diheme cytochrome c family protein